MEMEKAFWKNLFRPSFTVKFLSIIFIVSFILLNFFPVKVLADYPPCCLGEFRESTNATFAVVSGWPDDVDGVWLNPRYEFRSVLDENHNNRHRHSSSASYDWWGSQGNYFLIGESAVLQDDNVGNNNVGDYLVAYSISLYGEYVGGLFINPEIG